MAPIFIPIVWRIALAIGTVAGTLSFGLFRLRKKSEQERDEEEKSEKQE